ncbi:hypothetical protein BAUCODRAFT_86743, partial [Baudoinia panamericana UAMH 10762]
MAPKRKQPATTTTTSSKSAAATTTTAPKPRRSKLAKDNDLTAEEETEIHEAFALFCTSADAKKSRIATSEVPRCLIALNAPAANAAEKREIVDTLDPENTGWVGYEHFVAVAALKMHQVRDSKRREGGGGGGGGVDEEVRKAYALFTKGEEREIDMRDLRRVAGELREEVPEAVLRDMLREATGGGLGGVSMEDFEGVMRRAGV